MCVCLAGGMGTQCSKSVGSQVGSIHPVHTITSNTTVEVTTSIHHSPITNKKQPTTWGKASLFTLWVHRDHTQTKHDVSYVHSFKERRRKKQKRGGGISPSFLCVVVMEGRVVVDAGMIDWFDSWSVFALDRVWVVSSSMVRFCGGAHTTSSTGL